jgi:hypothetical protein
MMVKAHFYFSAFPVFSLAPKNFFIAPKGNFATSFSLFLDFHSSHPLRLLSGRVSLFCFILLSFSILLLLASFLLYPVRARERG